jgi:hypothetical protein
MEEGGRSHFVLEVDDLNHRILNLRDTVTSLFEVLNKRRSDAATALQLVQDSVQVIQEVAAASPLMLTADSSAAAASAQWQEDGLAVDQLAALRNQLARLSQAEARLAAAAAIPSQSTAAGPITALVPFNNSR